jgi:hypothetical protein
MRKFLIAVLIALPQAAFAWGGVGHRIIGELAVRSFPAEIPAFLRGPEAPRSPTPRAMPASRMTMTWTPAISWTCPTT